MRYGSVCSGIEAASVAWEPLGWSPAWFSEIEPFPSAVLAHHWPDVPNLGDMLTLPGRVAAGNVEAPDVRVGGTPCQAFSLAGRRASLEDERGALTLAFVELADAVDKRRADLGRDPCVIVWENVPGVLGTKDNAFGCLLAGLAGETEPLVPAGKRWTNAGAVLGPRRFVAWRLLDAQHFGVPQRRRRVFVVASARPDLDAVALLLECEGMQGDSASSSRQGRREAHDHGDAALHGVWWNGDDVSQTLDAVLYKKQCLPEKNRFPAVLVPAWVPEGDEGDFWCVYHDASAVECPCPEIDEWMAAGLCPYDPSLLRYITPEEGEALQGFPKGHTAVPYRGRQAPDTRRYEAVGNSMPVPVMHWIGRRVREQVDVAEFDLEFGT